MATNDKKKAADAAAEVINYGAKGDADVGAKALKNLDKMMGKGTSIIDQVDAKAARDARRAAVKAKLAETGGKASTKATTAKAPKVEAVDPIVKEVLSQGGELGGFPKGAQVTPNRNTLRQILAAQAKEAAGMAPDLYPTELMPAAAIQNAAELMPGVAGAGLGPTALGPASMVSGPIAGPGRMEQVAALASQANGLGGNSRMIGGFPNMGPSLVNSAISGAESVADDAVRYGLDDFLAAGAGGTAAKAAATDVAEGAGGAASRSGLRNLLGRAFTPGAKALAGEGAEGATGAVAGALGKGAMLKGLGIGLAGQIGGQFLGHRLDQADFGGENSGLDRFLRNAAPGAGIGAGLGTLLFPGLGTAAGAAAGAGVGALGVGLMGLIGGNKVSKADQIGNARERLMTALASAPDEVRSAFMAQYNMQAPLLKSGKQADDLAMQIGQQAAATALQYQQQQQEQKARLAFQGQLGQLFMPYLDQANEGATLYQMAANRAADTLNDPEMAAIYRARAANSAAMTKGMTAGYATQMANPDLAQQLGLARQLAAQQQQQYINQIAAEMGGGGSNSGSALTDALARAGMG